MCVFLVIFCLLFSSSVVVSAQTAELDSMFNQALSKLEHSVSKIEDLQSDLKESKNYISSLETLSSEQKETLLRQATILEEQSGSLSSINKLLTDTSMDLMRVREKLADRTRIVIIAGIIAALIIACKVLAFYLYIKGVPIPRWLDILL